MNMRHAKYILKIHECKSISVAAKKMFISQPALSQTVKNVEKELGIEIFDRSTNPIELTAAGRKYLEVAKRILELEENFSSELHEIKEGVSGKLRIGISSIRGTKFMPKILPIFIEKYPSVDVEIYETGSANTNTMLLDKKIDVAFSIAIKERSKNINYEVLYRERMILCAGKDTDIAKRIKPYSKIDITEAKDESFISLTVGHGVRAMQEYIFLQKNISPNICFELDNVNFAKALAKACNVVTLFPETLLDENIDLSRNDDIFYFIEGESFKRNFHLCYYKDVYHPKYFYDFIDISKDIISKSAFNVY